MAAVWMKIAKFGDAPVLIDAAHPLAVAQRARDAAAPADTPSASAPAAQDAPASVARRDQKKGRR
jgi:hypothetical protein